VFTDEATLRQYRSAWMTTYRKRSSNQLTGGTRIRFEMLRRNHNRSEVVSLKPDSVPVGALQGSRYTSTPFQLEVGDVLVAYTDGITESENSDGNPFGYERLERILCVCGYRDPQEILRHILDELSAHSAGCSQTDDITLLVSQAEVQDGVSCFDCPPF